MNVSALVKHEGHCNPWSVLNSNPLALEDVAIVKSGVAPPRRSGEGLYVRSRHVNGDEIRLADLDEGEPPTNDGSALRPGDVLLAQRGEDNPAMMLPTFAPPWHPIFATSDLAVIRVRSSVLLPNYLVAWLNRPATQRAMRPERAASMTPRVSVPALKALAIHLPSLERQRTIADLANAIDQEERTQRRLTAERRALLEGLLRREAEGKTVPT